MALFSQINESNMFQKVIDKFFNENSDQQTFERIHHT